MQSYPYVQAPSRDFAVSKNGIVGFSRRRISRLDERAGRLFATARVAEQVRRADGPRPNFRVFPLGFRELNAGASRSEAKLIYFGPALPEGRFSRADSVAGNRIP